jgi:hypothetical protein
LQDRRFAMKRWYTPSMLFPAVLMVACMVTVPQTAYAKVGGAIGKASATLTNCTKTACTLTITINVNANKNLKPNTEYDTYISATVCPDLTGVSYGPAVATSDSKGSFSGKYSAPLDIITFPSSEQVCVFSNADKAANALIPGNLVGRGHLSVKGKKGSTMVHSITA